MERKRQRVSSPPRGTQGGHIGPDFLVTSDQFGHALQAIHSQAAMVDKRQIVTRTFDLVTSKEVVPYYILSAIYAFYYSPKCQSSTTPRPVDHVIFSILPLLYLLELVHQPPDNTCPIHDQARKYIRMGLVMSSIGLGLLVWKPDVHLICWVGSACLALSLYSIAFYQYYEPGIWSKGVIPLLILLMGILIYLSQDIQIRYYIAVYGLFLTVLAFFAVARMEKYRSGPAYLGLSGSMLFLLSFSLFALNGLKAYSNFVISDTVIDMTSYLGQLGIALSTYTVKLCAAGEPCVPESCPTPGRTDSSDSVDRSRSRTSR